MLDVQITSTVNALTYLLKEYTILATKRLGVELSTRPVYHVQLIAIIMIKKAGFHYRYAMFVLYRYCIDSSSYDVSVYGNSLQTLD